MRRFNPKNATENAAFFLFDSHGDIFTGTASRSFTKRFHSMTD